VLIWARDGWLLILSGPAHFGSFDEVVTSNDPQQNAAGHLFAPCGQAAYTPPMNGVLYRKYRPVRFAEVVEQEHVTTTLKNQLKANQVGHAYLLIGPRGVGKTTLARVLARAVNCTARQDDGEPCGTCPSCVAIAAGSSVDVVEMDAASNRGINEIRELKEGVKYPPQQLVRKVLIIDEVHMLTPEAFNALLKTLEEPPAYLLFILATTEAHKLPETIISRCQRFDLRRITPAGVVARLKDLAGQEGLKVEDEVLTRIAYQSGGALRDAEVLLTQVAAVADGKKVTAAHADVVLPRSDISSVAELASAIAKADITSCLGLIQKLADDCVVFEQFSQQLLEYLRLALLIASGMQATTVAPGYDATIQSSLGAVARAIPAAKLAAMVDELLQQLRGMKTSPLPQLPLELFCVRAILSLGNESNDTTRHDPPASPPPPPSPIPFNPKPIKKSVIATEGAPKLAEGERRGGKNEAISPSVQDEPSKPSAPIDAAKLHQAWEQVREIVATQSRSLSAFLKVAKVMRVDGNLVTLGWRYDFQAERAQQPTCVRMLASALADALGSAVAVDHVVDESYDSRPWWPHIADEPRQTTPQLEDLSALVKTLNAQAVEV
jgi:DNA polymerase-3 subunit gamma/tau